MSLQATVSAFLVCACASLLVPNLQCGHAMDNTFCKALQHNDRNTLRKEVDRFLNTLKTNASEQERLQQLKDWIESQDCVSTAEISTATLDTDPPVKQLIVHLKDNTHQTIGIRLSPGRMKFNQ